MHTQHPTPGRFGLSPLGGLLPAALLTLATAIAPYAVKVSGMALSPRYNEGDLAAITPTVNADPATIKPGSIVLAAIATNKEQPHRFDRPALFVLTDDLELAAGSGAGERIRPGAYILLGVAQEGVTVAPVA